MGEQWESLARDWTRVLRAEHKSPKTIEIYTRAVHQLADYLTAERGELPRVGEVARRDVQDFTAYMIETRSAGTANTTDL